MPRQPYAARGSLLGKLRLAKTQGDLDHLVVEIEGEDEPRKVDVPNVRQWAQRVMPILSDLPWSRVELRNKKGGTLGVHMRDASDEPMPGELENLPTSAANARDMAMLNVMLKAQDLATSRLMSLMDPVLQVLFKLVDTSMKRLDLTEKQYEHALKVQSQMADDLVRSQLQQLAGTVEGGDSERAGNSKMIEMMWPAILQSVLAKPDAPQGERGAPERRPLKKAAPKPNGVHTNGVKAAAGSD